MNKISKTEEMVMTVIWQTTEHQGLNSIMENANKRYSKQWKQQTVSTFLSRLTKKGYLETYRKGRYTYYVPAVKVEDYRKQQLIDMAKNLYSGKWEDMEHDIAALKSKEIK